MNEWISKTLQDLFRSRSLLKSYFCPIVCDNFRIQSSRDYEQLLKTIMRLVKRLPNDTVDKLMEYKDELTGDLVTFLKETANIVRQGSTHMVQAARDFTS